MSAFIGIVDKHFAVVGTDTLSSYPLERDDVTLQPHSYTCKTYLLPQFKSALSVTGMLKLGINFYALLVESALGIDIDSLVNIDLKIIKQKLNDSHGQILNGSIYLVGFSYNSDCFKGFKLIVENENMSEWEEFPASSLILKPGIEEWEEKLSDSGDSKTYIQLIVNLMKLQKFEDENKSITERVGIGGEVVCTQFEFIQDSLEIRMTTTVAYKFHDYEALGELMMTRSIK